MPASNCYLDTNVLLAACLAEEVSPRVRQWIERANGPLATSDWAVAEFASAMGIKVRRGQFTPGQADGAIDVPESKLLPSLRLIETESELVRAWAVLLRTYRLGLRTGDGLHLAFCLRERALKLATADRALARAGAEFGVTIEQIC